MREFYNKRLNYFRRNSASFSVAGRPVTYFVEGDSADVINLGGAIRRPSGPLVEAPSPGVGAKHPQRGHEHVRYRHVRAPARPRQHRQQDYLAGRNRMLGRGTRVLSRSRRVGPVGVQRLSTQEPHEDVVDDVLIGMKLRAGRARRRSRRITGQAQAIFTR